MIIYDAIKLSKEGFVAFKEGMSFIYSPEEKVLLFSKPPIEDDYKQQWSVRWPTKKESSIWLKK